ncbi:MAG: carbohydrate binding family 9 domain-containing protein [Gemmatimonadales bacterium]|nr:carbohydrate binding family 9 domain-containing protein [Gemmatimonadales bacterium]
MTPAPALPTATAVRATRVSEPPVLDGRDADAAWGSAPAIDRFLQAKPSEGAAPRLRTEARVAYDADNLYVFVRAFDPHPDSIVSLLSRRDDQTSSDLVTLMLDPYHDRRTGYQFEVNPAGVKADYAIYNDGNEDVSWDAVWDVATRIDSLGWTAEYRIPLSQLHYSAKGDVTFGLLVWRVIQRYTETVTWPLYRTSRSGITSQFGELTGLEGLSSPAHAEVTPYLVTKNVQGPASDDYGRDQEVTVGGDVKYRVASNLLLNATVNPDFGQVEADPSVLNLGAFETFFREQRPFFVEGKGLFTFNVNCVVVVDCETGEGLFYSRRIGRSPQLADRYGDESSPTSTRILGAAKVTGRLPGGFSVGVLDAVTDDVGGPGGTLEPSTNYLVARGNQDYHYGDGSFGFIATAVSRSLDPSSEPFLHGSAYTGGIDGRRRFGGTFEVSGSFDFSRVAGSAEAIARTQQDPVHLYQRPDGPLDYDSTRTALSGTNLELRFAKVGGRRLVFETAYQRRSAGFEINDVGFLRQADQQMWTSWAALAFRNPNRVFRELRWNFNNWEHWSIAGLPTERAFNTNVHTQFNNRWWLHVGGTLGQLGATYCDRCARGGPAIRQDPYMAPWAGIEGDERRPLVPAFWVNYWRGDRGRSESLELEPEVKLKVSTRFTTSLSATYERNRNDTQYVGTFTDPEGARHYTFAHLEQKTLALTWRLGYTFTPNTSLQVYASPFVSKGTYTDVREVGQARAAAYEARYRPYADEAVAGDPGGFNVQEFRSNLVFRWEYRPGSTLFLVWSQGRQAAAEFEGAKSFGGDLRDLFRQRANHTFLVKVSYWLAR